MGIGAVAGSRLLQAVEALQLRMGRSQRIDTGGEGLHPGMPRAVDEADRSTAGQRRLQHGQQRGDADAGTDQHQRLARGTQGEIAGRGEQLQLIALAHLLMQMVGDPPTNLALDADAVLAAVRRLRQRVVAPHLFAIQAQAQADVLAGNEVEQGAAIGWLQVEGGDLLALAHLAHHAEGTPAAPAASRTFGGGIDLLLGADQQVGQLAIGRGPGGDHRVGRHLGAEHLADGAQQAAADDRVVLGEDLQRHVLLHDLPNQRAERLQAVDVLGVHQHAVGQRARLVAAGLVRLVEQRAHLRVLGEHDAVEVGGQRLAAGFQQGHRGLDDGDVFVGQHIRSSCTQGYSALGIPGIVPNLFFI